MNTWTPASAASPPRWLMNGRNADPSAAAAQHSSFIRKERRPFCNRFIHQRLRPEGGTLLCSPERNKRKGNEAKDKQMEENTNCVTLWTGTGDNYSSFKERTVEKIFFFVLLFPIFPFVFFSPCNHLFFTFIWMLSSFTSFLFSSFTRPLLSFCFTLFSAEVHFI